MAKTVVILLLAFALAGCTQVVTDVTTVSSPGRYEVSLPGSGVTLGGILLLIPGTITLGALISLGAVINVFTFSTFYDVPVRLGVAHMILCACFLLLPDIPRFELK